MAIKTILGLFLALSVGQAHVPPPTHQFHFARLKYEVRADSMYPQWAGYKDWLTDFADGSGSTPMDETLTIILKRLTDIDVGQPVQVEPLDRRLRDYPFLYAVEPEQMDLTKSEADALRRYLDRGGFLMVDDFHGTDETEHVFREMRKIFTDGAQIERLSLSHEIFHTFFDIRDIIQVPVADQGRLCNQVADDSHDFDGRCITWEQDGVEPYVYGIYDAKHRLVVVMAANTDLGDGLEWADDPEYPHRFSKFSMQFFTDVIIYALTH